MEALQHTMSELRDYFEGKMAEFQKNLQSSSIPATSPTSNIAAQFAIFRNFVLGALEGLQSQLSLLAAKSEELEMRSRRKILLVHGIQEGKNENPKLSVFGMISDQLKIPDIRVESISRCHRIGQSNSRRPRAILVKFHDLALRNKVWFAKTNLKNSGITLSEFLTKERHDVFVAARQRFGITKCWTKNGYIVVIGADGSHSRFTTMADFNNLGSSAIEVPSPNITVTATTSTVHKENRAPNVRPKRVTKK